jgi:hypothetical protein
MAAVSTNYRIPVQVNGFACKNCTDVDYAKRHIDPQHPKSGPYNVNAATDTSRAGVAALSPTGTILNAAA